MADSFQFNIEIPRDVKGALEKAIAGTPNSMKGAAAIAISEWLRRQNDRRLTLDCPNCLAEIDVTDLATPTVVSAPESEAPSIPPELYRLVAEFIRLVKHPDPEDAKMRKHIILYLQELIELHSK